MVRPLQAHLIWAIPAGMLFQSPVERNKRSSYIFSFGSSHFKIKKGALIAPCPTLVLTRSFFFLPSPQGSFHTRIFLFTFRGDSFRSEFRKISLREHLGVTQSSPPFSRERERRNRVSRLPSCPSLLIINSGFEIQKGNREIEAICQLSQTDEALMGIWTCQ